MYISYIYCSCALFFVSAVYYDATIAVNFVISHNLCSCPHIYIYASRPNNTDVAACMTNLAVSHINTGDTGPAPEALLKKALEVYEQQEIELNELEDEDVQDDQGIKGGASLLSKQLDACEPLCNVHTILGHMYYMRGDEEKAIENYRAVEDIYKLGMVKDDSRCAPAMGNLALIMWKRGEKERAEELFREVLFAKRFEAGSNSFLEFERLLSALKEGQEEPPGAGWRDNQKDEIARIIEENQ